MMFIEKVDPEHYTSAFRVEELARFEGGDMKGDGVVSVVQNFFCESHRTLLVGFGVFGGCVQGVRT